MTADIATLHRLSEAIYAALEENDDRDVNPLDSLTETDRSAFTVTELSETTLATRIEAHGITEESADLSSTAFCWARTARRYVVDHGRREVKTRAFSEYPITVAYGDPDPFEIEVRGIPTVVSIGTTLSTHAINPPGSPFWSETGYRSFGGFYGMIDPELRADLPALAEKWITDYIDQKPKKDGGGGLGGKLVSWWPMCAITWRQERLFVLEYEGTDFWAHHGPEKQAELWSKKRQSLAEDFDKMVGMGIDPNKVLAGLKTSLDLPRYERVGDGWREAMKPAQLSLF